MQERYPVAGYNWTEFKDNYSPQQKTTKYIEINDEALRDGQQALVEIEPTEDEKKAYIIHTSRFAEKIDLGFPGSGVELKSEIINLAKFIRDEDLQIKPMVTGRGASAEDVNSIIDVAEELDGFKIEAYIFLDVSKERAKLEGWNREENIKAFIENTKKLVSRGITTGVVIERWSRTSPQDQQDFIEAVLGEGATILTLADTQGIHNHDSLTKQLRWTFNKFGTKFPDIEYDAHFHNQRGLAVSNSLIAASEGIDRIHVTPGGIGEGSGNTDYVTLLVNLNMDNYRNDNLKQSLIDIKDSYQIFGIQIPKNAPFHSGSFETSSGIHQSTLYKGVKNPESLNFYFCIPPEEVGENFTILINRLSGKAGVRYVLENQENLTPSDEMINEVLEKAKSQRGRLSQKTIRETAMRYNKDIK